MVKIGGGDCADDGGAGDSTNVGQAFPPSGLLSWVELSIALKVRLDKFSSCVAGFAALSGTPVFAADMAVKAPPPAVVPASIPYSRTGIYLDADVGWGNFIPATISGECQCQRGHYLGQGNGEI